MQIRMVRDQLNKAKGNYGALAGTLSAGPGGAMLPTEGGVLFDKSIDSLRGGITAITRVPGVGAMSDYETRLDQAKFPSRNLYESAGNQQLQSLDDMLNALEVGYADMLGEEIQQPSAPAAQAAPAAPTAAPKRRRFDAQGREVQ
jgi:hypothetical protein